MQGVRRLLGRIGESDILLGLVALAVVIVVGCTISYFYLVPAGQQTVTFTTRDAVALSTGLDVRVSGISVGKVKKITLQKNDVKVDLEVDKTVRIGNKSAVDVSLLTAVGGYFVSIVPGGDVTPGSTTIPADRVRVPYTIADTLQELPRITGNVKGQDIEGALQSLSSGLAHNSGAVKSMIAGLHSIAQTMDHQRGEVESIMTMADNYLTTFNGSRDFLFSLIRKANIALSQYYTYRAGFSEAYRQLGEVLRRLGTIAQFYLNHSKDIYNAVVAVRGAIDRMRGGMDQMIKNLEPVRDQLNRLVPDASRDGTAFELGAICLPIYKRAC